MNDEPTNTGEDEHAADQESGTTVEQDEKLAERIRELTPSNEDLLKRARKFPPPPEWFSQDEERPF